MAVLFEDSAGVINDGTLQPRYESREPELGVICEGDGLFVCLVLDTGVPRHVC